MLVPLPLLVSGVAAALAFGLFSGWTVQNWRYGAKINGLEAHYAQQAQKAESAARALEQRWQKRVQEVTDAGVKRQKVLQGRIASADTALASLRSAIDAADRRASQNPSGACASDDSRVAGKLLAECSERYRDVAAAADSLKDQVSGLMEFVEGLK